MAEAAEVSPDRCPDPRPREEEPCNAFDCEPGWQAEPWSKCSRSCGGGFQTRKLQCEKVLAPLSQSVQLPPSKCLKTRPKAIKKCNLKPCPKTASRTTTTSTTTSEPEPVVDNETDFLEPEPGGEVFVQKDPNRRVTLKASGQALLFRGSDAKLHCPVDPPEPRVLWFKGHLRIPAATAAGWPRVSVSGKGALRLHRIAPSDAGAYTCLAGAFRSDVRIRVRPPPAKDTGRGVVSSPAPSLPRSNRSALPQVRHFLVNARHFAGERTVDPVILGHEWVLGQWSRCSHSCGEAAIQLRTVECRITVMHNTTRHVPKGLCIEGGLQEPSATRRCELDPCPEWAAGNWTECSLANCLSRNTSFQKRPLACVLGERPVAPSHCDSRDRPRRKRECFNPACRGRWRTGRWAQCTSTCGVGGFRTRRVDCVWVESEDVAPPGACKGLPPAASERCGETPCSHGVEEDCRDRSTYCDVVKGTKLCEATLFRAQCCASCTMRE